MPNDGCPETDATHILHRGYGCGRRSRGQGTRRYSRNQHGQHKLSRRHVSLSHDMECASRRPARSWQNIEHGAGADRRPTVDRTHEQAGVAIRRSTNHTARRHCAACRGTRRRTPNRGARATWHKSKRESENCRLACHSPLRRRTSLEALARLYCAPSHCISTAAVATGRHNRRIQSRKQTRFRHRPFQSARTRSPGVAARIHLIKQSLAHPFLRTRQYLEQLCFLSFIITCTHQKKNSSRL